MKHLFDILVSLYQPGREVIDKNRCGGYTTGGSILDFEV
jgi:hypothetical protein